jgi:2-C-methyl-D-erythritol 4-phosphate cytidylyltransferase
MYCHILTSIIGSHPNIQDAIKYYESDDTIVAVVAEGLGSRKMSAPWCQIFVSNGRGIIERSLLCLLQIYSVQRNGKTILNQTIATSMSFVRRVLLR